MGFNSTSAGGLMDVIIALPEHGQRQRRGADRVREVGHAPG